MLHYFHLVHPNLPDIKATMNHNKLNEYLAQGYLVESVR